LRFPAWGTSNLDPEVTATKYYEQMGIDNAWGEMDICLDDARVAMADSFSQTAWNLAFTCARMRRQRTLAITDGYPRTFTLLLDEASRPAKIEQFKQDYELFLEFKGQEHKWADLIVKRSLFQRVRMMQMVRCFEVEKWMWTARLRCSVSC